MESVMLIKKYFLTDDDIVIKYKNNSTEKKSLNRVNLKNLIEQLDKQYPFDMENIIKHQDSMYSKIAYITFIMTLIEGIIFLNLLISFEVGTMKNFIICSILSGCCIGIHLLYLLISVVILLKLKKKYKICLGKSLLKSKYEILFGSIDEKEPKARKKAKEVKNKDTKVINKDTKVKSNENDKKELTKEEIEKKQAKKKKAKAKKRKAKKNGTRPAKKKTK